MNFYASYGLDHSICHWFLLHFKNVSSVVWWIKKVFNLVAFDCLMEYYNVFGWFYALVVFRSACGRVSYVDRWLNRWPTENVQNNSKFDSTVNMYNISSTFFLLLFFWFFSTFSTFAFPMVRVYSLRLPFSIAIFILWFCERLTT